MKHIAMLLGALASIVLAFVSVLSAGVVMSETAMTSGPSGHIAQERTTIYIQGNKQRVDTGDVQTITDLDKRLLYIVDKKDREYVEESLQTGSGTYPESGEAAGSVVLKRTGRTHLVAYQRCNEYRGTWADQNVNVTVSACVSDAGPGVQEIARFNREMISQVSGSKSRTPGEEATSGIMLEKHSVVELRRRYKSRHYRRASLTMKSKIEDIKLTQLPAGTFLPPKGFNKVNDESVKIREKDESVALTLPSTHLEPGRFLRQS
jgi:hypothetical protein